MKDGLTLKTCTANCPKFGLLDHGLIWPHGFAGMCRRLFPVKGFVVLPILKAFSCVAYVCVGYVVYQMHSNASLMCLLSIK